MPQSDRQNILKAQGTAPEITIDLFSAGLLREAPELYGSAAWLHFKQAENGCRFVADVLSETAILGEPQFERD